MKNNLPFRRVPAGVIAVAILAVTTLMAPAQSLKEAEEKNRAALKAAAAGDASRGAFDINITDGLLDRNGKKEEATLEKVIEVVRERHPEANIVLSPRLPSIRISNLKLRAASLEQELEALRVASGFRFVWNTGRGVSPFESPQVPVPQPPVIDPTTGMPVPSAPAAADMDPATGNERAPLYILSEMANMPDRRQVEVFNMSAFIERLDGKDKKDIDASLLDLQDVIASTMREQGNPSPDEMPHFTFHSGANLLIVTGPEAAIEVARKVIGAAGGQASGPIDRLRRDINNLSFSPTSVPNEQGFQAMKALLDATSGGGAQSSQKPMSKARRAIYNKLENIRLDSVKLDTMPLSEVVNFLRDQAKKNDPEKAGVNFLIDPSLPLGRARGRPPTELPPIDSVSIRLLPGLSDVRLVDVLDAIVKVAEHPIQYSVTDYGVVFGLASPFGDVPLPPGYNPGSRH